MKQLLSIRTLALRIALGVTFLSAVASRLSLWGSTSSDWNNFLEYTAAVNSFAPASLIPTLAVVATTLEILFGIALIIGFKVKYIATGAGVLTLLFALAMAYSFGIKDPLDYSVFVDSAAAFLLAAMPTGKWSLDALLENKTLKQQL